jgi:hypothetical protein
MSCETESGQTDRLESRQTHQQNGQTARHSEIETASKHSKLLVTMPIKTYAKELGHSVLKEQKKMGIQQTGCYLKLFEKGEVGDWEI